MNNAAADPKILEATDWLLRLTDESADGREVEAWRTWLAASPENRSAFERAQEVWDLAPRIERAPWPTDREVQADVHDTPQRSRVLALAASVAAVAIGAGVAVWHAQHPAAPDVFVTGIGESRRLVLADGSQVTLGGASKLRLDFSAERRLLELQSGEAFFQVRRDAVRPFMVHAGAAKITALGTAFSVRRAADRVEVAVTEGLVQLATLDSRSQPSLLPRSAVGQSDERLAAGRQAVIESGTLHPSIPADVSAVLARREGRLQYTSEPLRYVVADLSRYSNLPIELDGDRTGDLLVTGTVLEGDLQGWLQGLEQALPVTVSMNRERIRIRER